MTSLNPTTELQSRQRRWLVTGGAGFIGSNLATELLNQGQEVIVLDNLATGHRSNIDSVLEAAPVSSRASFLEADIRDYDACLAATDGVDVVLHQAALGSVPRSLADPRTTDSVNIAGFLNVLEASRINEVGRFVYAASSSTYGDDPNLPKREDRIGNPLSPYAVTKRVNELYADTYALNYGMSVIGLRYFNVFGPRQDPEGAYAAVIPKWIKAMVDGSEVTINGDGETSRDFCFIRNVVQANLRAGLVQAPEAQGQIYNVAVGDSTTLTELFGLLKDTLAANGVAYDRAPRFADFRKGDVRHSLADVSKAGKLLGYSPSHTIRQGLEEAMPWYLDSLVGTATEAK